ncbi:PREDICTED: uncharacterized protein LOC107170058 [Diuraphis noxia]|uniref:uncharacterized protein LOC107170058 n=1 Tax=Diuraphis noxia TaxID=143948 RepID=UPI0007636E7A|nr:PREDICTED: uncharacterized protein LOC107170058 [Diuraphis noxia]
MPPKNAFRCVVGDCKSKEVICHRFPNPRTDMERLKTWMKIVGLEYDDPNLVYAKKFICSLHFTSNCSSIGTKRLNANALPSLFCFQTLTKFLEERGIITNKTSQSKSY